MPRYKSTDIGVWMTRPGRYNIYRRYRSKWVWATNVVTAEKDEWIKGRTYLGEFRETWHRPYGNDHLLIDLKIYRKKG
jgi:hypothetical protein